MLLQPLRIFAERNTCQSPCRMEHWMGSKTSQAHCQLLSYSEKIGTKFSLLSQKYPPGPRLGSALSSVSYPGGGRISGGHEGESGVTVIGKRMQNLPYWKCLLLQSGALFSEHLLFIWGKKSPAPNPKLVVCHINEQKPKTQWQSYSQQ